MSEEFRQTGGCHCRVLRYTLTHPPLSVYACHCTDCQSLSGSAFGIGVVISDAAFTLEGTPRLVQRILGSGAIGTRCICPDCGVWLCGNARPDLAVPGGKRVLRGGTFDDTSWLRPTAHIWTRSAQPWVVFPQGATIYPTAPP